MDFLRSLLTPRAGRHVRSLSTPSAAPKGRAARVRRISLTGMTGLASVAILLLTACGGNQSGTGANKNTITVAFQQYGNPPYYQTQWLQRATTVYQQANPGMHVKLEPIVASEGDYYTKIDLMMQSASTAPDVVLEDSFRIAADQAAGYLRPLDSYLSKWSDYQNNWYPGMQKITSFGGKNYGVMVSTDTRFIYFNKDLFQRAGLPTDWHPKTWDDILAAAKTIKQKEPDIIPMMLSSGVPADEAATMQGFEMLVYGTSTPLYDYSTNKWIVSSPGFLHALQFVRQVYNNQNRLGPPDSIVLNPQSQNITAEQLLPQGKLAMDIDGSWLPSDWVPGGPSQWPQWNSTLGEAQMPTENGDAINNGQPYTSLSGGWALSMTAKGNNPDQAFKFIQTATSTDQLSWYDVKVGDITPSNAVAQTSDYQNENAISNFATSLLKYSQFRPAFPAYPQISLQIDQAMQAVMQGTSPQDAMNSYAQAVTHLVGSNSVETK